MIPDSEKFDTQAPPEQWLFDRITVEGRAFINLPYRFTGRQEFDWPSEPVSFCLVGAYWCDYASGPNLTKLADLAGKLTGAGFYGLKSARRNRDGEERRWENYIKHREAVRINS